MPLTPAAPDGPVRFDFGRGVTLEIRGPRAVCRHFTAEYGAAASAEATPPATVISFDSATAANQRYKTVRWRIELGDPAEDPLRAHLAVAGRPRSFALSLLQGYVVEPLLAIAAARVASVLLPSAAIEGDRGYVLLLGRSRSGKSSLCARALAAGRSILGDDHVLLDAEGGRAFPRRLRLYSDLELTAPAAYGRIGGTGRAALTARRLVRLATRGWVAPPLRLQSEQLGRPFPRTPVQLERVVAIERAANVADLAQAELAAPAIIDLAQAIADEQRARLAQAAGPPAWERALAAAREEDRRVLVAALRGLPAQTFLVPADWGAPRAVDALAAAIGLDRRRAVSD